MTSPVLDPGAQSALWEHMFKKGTIRLGSMAEYRQRVTLLKELEEDVTKGRYSLRPIHGFLSAPKGNNVARFIPVLSFQDVAVYFGCVRAFDEDLAAAAVDDTYGGWTLGGKRRQAEEQWARQSFDSAVDRADPRFPDMVDAGVSVPVSAYNRWAWLKNWQEYWKLVAAMFEHAPDSTHFAMLDMANYYDSIDLPRLQRNLRKFSDGRELAIEVLFHLLATWNREQTRYAPTTKGIPQDYIGDCSRVLANFYLTPFDRQVREAGLQASSQYLRFADDMVFVCPDLCTCQDLVFRASSEACQMGLNINSAKVKYFTKEEFGTWWGFAVMDALGGDEHLVDGLYQLKLSLEDENFGRRYSALKRAIMRLGRIPEMPQWGRWFYETAVSNREFVLQLDERQMRSLALIAGDPAEALKAIDHVVMASPYTQPKACFLRCLEYFLPNDIPAVREVVNGSIECIRALGDPILDLAARNMLANS